MDGISADSLDIAPDLWFALDILGTFVFALSGGLLAARKRFDIVGIIVLSVAAGLGGGMTRDVLLGDTPPVAFREEIYLLTALLAAAAVFLLYQQFNRMDYSIRLLDAVGLGVFAVSGTLKSLDFDLGPLPAILLGTVTGAGGGVIRDLLAREVPLILERDIYALAAVLGATTLVILLWLGLDTAIAAGIGVLATIGIRVLALRYNWQAPRARRLTHDDPDAS
ncbi:MAG: trimeric intracellular cation channel family protein [Sphaerobacteraceae bacterium]|nr:MAG: trimeric intracellular cation channel family protein [Sphaerobacteraceae bacterium]